MSFVWVECVLYCDVYFQPVKVPESEGSVVGCVGCVGCVCAVCLKWTFLADAWVGGVRLFHPTTQTPHALAYLQQHPRHNYMFSSSCRLAECPLAPSPPCGDIQPGQRPCLPHCMFSVFFIFVSCFSVSPEINVMVLLDLNQLINRSINQFSSSCRLAERAQRHPRPVEDVQPGQRPCLPHCLRP